MDKIFISAPWFFTHTVMGIHNLIPLLGADVTARFYRLKGYDVTFVSGADEHGARSEILANRYNLTPDEISSRVFHTIQDLLMNWLQISTSKFCRTNSAAHHAFVTKFYRAIFEKKRVHWKLFKNLYCEKCGLFLYERFVTGKCPSCKSTFPVGDECKVCGTPIQVVDLLDPHCAICGSSPVIRKTMHWCVDLNEVKTWLLNQDIEIIANQVIKQNLDKQLDVFGFFPLTRDLQFGIKSPFPKSKGKMLYSWSESILGRLSCFDNHELEKIWRAKNVEKIFFMGKDNVLFFRYLLPALLYMADESYCPPTRIVANEFLKFEGRACSKSDGIGIWLDEAKLLVENPDYWRIYLLRNFPLQTPYDFKLEDFSAFTNDFFVSKLNTLTRLAWSDSAPGGNGKTGITGSSAEASLLDGGQKTFNLVNQALEESQIKSALGSILEYLDHIEAYAKSSVDHTHQGCFVLREALHRCAVLLSPFVPQTSQSMIALLGLGNEPQMPEKWSRLEKGEILSRDAAGEIRFPLQLFTGIDPDDLIKNYQCLQRQNYATLMGLGELCENWNEGHLQ